MLYTEESVRANIRNREGQRVFFLGSGDRLTAAARDYLTRERIPILSGETAKPDRYRLLNGGYLEEKPEQMTHLNGEVLVPKTHPRIEFRGKMDTLEAELLLCQPELTQTMANKALPEPLCIIPGSRSDSLASAKGYFPAADFHPEIDNRRKH